MAKQQTFGDKNKKKAGDSKISVKVIKVDDVGQIEKMDLSR